MNPVRLVAIRETPLSLDEVYQSVTDAAAGGICVFIGTVRDHDAGQDVSALGYSSHPTALAKLGEVADRIAAECDVIALAGVHRVGELSIGDLAVVVAASAVHRADAFEACRRLIDELKTDVPVWKHQSFVSGGAEWVHPT